MTAVKRAYASVLHALYAWEMRGAELDALVSLLHQGWEDRRIPADVRLRADILMRLLEHHLPEIDRLLEVNLSNWRLSRLSVIDRNLLRMGAGEILYLADVAPAQTLATMVQLAERYSTPESPRFINGVLDAVARDATLSEVSHG